MRLRLFLAGTGVCLSLCAQEVPKPKPVPTPAPASTATPAPPSAPAPPAIPYATSPLKQAEIAKAQRDLLYHSSRAAEFEDKVNKLIGQEVQACGDRGFDLSALVCGPMKAPAPSSAALPTASAPSAPSAPASPVSPASPASITGPKPFKPIPKPASPPTPALPVRK